MLQFQKASRRMALCGVLSALALLFLCLGSLFPFATFCCPILAMLCLLPVVEEYGTKAALTCYLAEAMLAALLAPDKEAALLFAFLGWYPALRPHIERRVRHTAVRLAVKLLLFAVCVTAAYSLAIYALGMAYLAEEYAAEGQFFLWLSIVLGCVLWLLCDMVLARFTRLYRSKWRGRLFRR